MIQVLHELGQSIWIDHITRDFLTSGTFESYIEEFSVTGLAFNPSLFSCAIKNSSAYDAAIRKKLKEDKLGEELFYELALEDLRHAADTLRPIYDQTDGLDGWVSLEVSPLLVHDTECTLAAAKDLYARMRRPNIFIKIPGTYEGLSAVEEAIFAGIPVNVTLLFSREHYLAAAGAFLCGIERRIAAGLKPKVGSVASMSVSRWDAAVMDRVPDPLRNKLGVAVARRTYKAYCDLLSSPRWQQVHNAGVRPQRLLWSDTETVDSGTSGDFYIRDLTAPFSIINLSESTLKALMDCGDLGMPMPADGEGCEAVLGCFDQAGIDIDALSAEFQVEDAASAVKSWIELMSEIASKSASLVQAEGKTTTGRPAHREGAAGHRKDGMYVNNR
ncbi:MAG: transaldolase family protein [Desulfobacterales bacterium]